MYHPVCAVVARTGNWPCDRCFYMAYRAVRNSRAVEPVEAMYAARAYVAEVSQGYA